MKMKKTAIFICILIAVAIGITGFSEKKKIVVEAATATSNGVEWEYSIMSVAGGSSYAYDVKPTSEVTGSVTIPSTLGGVPVQALAARAFDGFGELTDVSIPSTLQTINEYAFDGCKNLKKVSIFNNISGSLSYIGEYAFGNCTSLTGIELEGVNNLGYAAFFGCTSLSEVIFSKELAEISPYAFSSCSSLTKVTINNENVNIGNYAFIFCGSLQKVTLPNTVSSMKLGECAFCVCSKLENFTFPCDAEISKKAFSSCYNLTDLVFEGKVTLGEEAFSYDSLVNPVSRTMTFKDDVVITGKNCFGNNGGITELNCQKNLTISSGVGSTFSSCDNLKKITVAGDFTDGGTNNFPNSKIETLNFGGNVSTTAEFPNLKSVTYTGNTTQLISAPSMELSETVSSVAGSINSSKATEVIFRNPSIDLSKVTVTGSNTSKVKLYALAGSSGESFVKNHSAVFEFSNIVVNKADLIVTSQQKEITVKQGETMPQITPALLGLTVQAKYYGKENAETIAYDNSNQLKGYQIISSELQAGENTIIIKYSGQEQKVILNIIQEKAEVSATPLVTQSPSVTQTPLISESPAITQTPVISNSPAITQTPIISASPLATQTPLISESPIVTQSPIITASPTVTQSPIITASPTVTQSPIITASPTATQTPIVSQQPAVSPIPTVIETPSVNQADLKDAVITLSKSTYYCAYKKIVKPSVTVKYNEVKLVKNQDYKISYTDNVAYGKGKVTITGMGAYTGVVEKTFLLLPEKSKITSAKTYIWRNQKVIKLIWKKQKGIEGYQIVYAYSKKGKYKEMSKKNANVGSAVLAFSKKKIYLKIRAYVHIGGKIKYGPYSSIEKAIVK